MPPGATRALHQLWWCACWDGTHARHRAGQLTLRSPHSTPPTGSGQSGASCSARSGKRSGARRASCAATQVCTAAAGPPTWPCTGGPGCVITLLWSPIPCVTCSPASCSPASCSPTHPAHPPLPCSLHGGGARPREGSQAGRAVCLGCVWAAARIAQCLPLPLCMSNCSQRASTVPPIPLS